ncbi:leucine-rich repeat-containing serine/threonine-protein kinase [Vibrio sp.]|nr:leucine-rich repeat-containing serine/threonine-protein kinase [Vibrio sp.]
MHTLEQLRSGSLKGTMRLKLSCNLTEFPTEIFSLADSLEILDLTDNNLSSLPDELEQLTKLKVLFCSKNLFQHLPSVLGRCHNLTMVGFKSNQISEVPSESLSPSLRWLILTDNCISALPDSIGQCSKLQKLMLAGNRLTSLPKSLASCHQLELLRISANQLTHLPNWLLSLPKLTWLAFAGNPFVGQLEKNALDIKLESIDWKNLEVSQLLGEGASGLIYRARLSQGKTTKDVAVKLFKGAMTSDGLPLCEMASIIKAGQHPSLTQAIGKIQSHPENTDGLVMKLIPSDIGTLAGPPSLSSCTRDIYPPEAQFSVSQLFKIIQSIADAVGHLHRQGIIHGDLYAHNILITPSGDTFLSDYGAASFLNLADQDQSSNLRRLEVRAFGYLLKELLERCYDIEEHTHHRLEALALTCLDPSKSNRPEMDEISHLLHEMTLE